MIDSLYAPSLPALNLADCYSDMIDVWGQYHSAMACLRQGPEERTGTVFLEMEPTPRLEVILAMNMHASLSWGTKLIAAYDRSGALAETGSSRKFISAPLRNKPAHLWKRSWPNGPSESSLLVPRHSWRGTSWLIVDLLPSTGVLWHLSNKSLFPIYFEKENLATSSNVSLLALQPARLRRLKPVCSVCKAAEEAHAAQGVILVKCYGAN